MYTEATNITVRQFKNATSSIVLKRIQGSTFRKILQQVIQDAETALNLPSLPDNVERCLSLSFSNDSASEDHKLAEKVAWNIDLEHQIEMAEMDAIIMIEQKNETIQELLSAAQSASSVTAITDREIAEQQEAYRYAKRIRPADPATASDDDT